MEQFIFSKHAIAQMENRNISMETVLKVLKNPNEIIISGDQIIYQSIIVLNNTKEYLVRIIVNSIKVPNMVITVYKTSKIQKYYEG